MKAVRRDVRTSTGLRSAALIAWLALAAASAAAESPVRQVLMLQSFNRGNLILDHFTGNFRVDLDQHIGGPVNYVQVSVGPTGFVGAPEQSVVDFIQSIYADGAKPELIVTLGGPAAVFARKYRQQLFPETPLLLGVCRPAIPGRCAAERERDCGRGPQRFPRARRGISCRYGHRPNGCSWWSAPAPSQNSGVIASRNCSADFAAA